MRPPGENGWTLVELLITVAVLAILAAIAVVQFAGYRLRAFNVAAESDIANIRLIEQALFTEYGDFGASALTTGSIILRGANLKTDPAYLTLSSNVYAGVKVLPSGGDNISFTAVAKHLNGNYAYATEPENQVIYRKEIAQGTALQDSDIPAATLGVDFTGPWSIIN